MSQIANTDLPLLQGDSEYDRRMEALLDSLESLQSDDGQGFMDIWKQPAVTEINLNDDGRVWVKRHGHDDAHFADLSAAEAMNVISLVADSVQEIVSFKKFKLECEFPLDGSRFSALVPPVARVPIFSLRKHNPVILPLEDFVEKGVFPAEVHDLIGRGIDERLNILVVGATASGKTTLVNSIIREMALHNPFERAVVVEDTRELKSHFGNTLSLRTCENVATLSDVISVVLRHSPDRIIVGEVRDEAALGVLSLWNTGHPGGICTIHANSAQEALPRMEDMVRKACGDPLRGTVGQAIDLLLFLEKARGVVAGRRLTQVQRCYGYDERKKSYNLEVLYEASV